MLKRYTLEPMGELWSEKSKFEHWLAVELAALRAKVPLGYLSSDACETIWIAASRDIINVARINELDAIFHHDMIAFVTMMQEELEQAGAGEYKGEFHKGFGSYDIEDPALMVMLRKATSTIMGELDKLQIALTKQAVRYKHAHMIGRTHGKWALPTTFGCLLMVHREEIRRGIRNLERLMMNELAEAKMSGEVGCYNSVDPRLESLALAHLGLRPALAETQILQRDRHARLLSEFSAIAGSIERCCSTFWQMMRSEVNELEEPRSSKQRGSSGMPHKKNPILTEQLQGLPRLIRSYMFAAHENIATPECRDISQSSVERHIFPDATTLMHYLAVKMTGLVQNLVVHEDEMRSWLFDKSCGVWASQAVKDALVEAGIDPSDVCTFTQQACFKAQREKKHFRDVLRNEIVTAGSNRTAEDIIGSSKLNSFFDVPAIVECGVNHIFREERER